LDESVNFADNLLDTLHGTGVGVQKVAKQQCFTISQVYFWRLALQIISGMRYLHRKQIYHRDLKLANVRSFSR
jgi:hypothetical protein